MKYTIAEILHIAADKYLAVKREEYCLYGGNKEKYSCCAVEEAVYRLYFTCDIEEIYQKENLVKRIKQGLKNMGCPVESVDAFKDNCDFVEENQQARYAWLKFAAMMAEEQESCLARLVKQGV